MDGCANVAIPALIYVEHTTAAHTGIKDLTVLVPQAPLAEMEAELFFSKGPPSAFEQKWCGDGALVATAMRRRVGEYVPSRGAVCRPNWLSQDEGDYMTRAGP